MRKGMPVPKMSSAEEQYDHKPCVISGQACQHPIHGQPELMMYRRRQREQGDSSRSKSLPDVLDITQSGAEITPGNTDDAVWQGNTTQHNCQRSVLRDRTDLNVESSLAHAANTGSSQDADESVETTGTITAQHLGEHSRMTQNAPVSQAHVNQMLRFCHSYISWLCPGIDAGHATDILDTVLTQTPSTMLLAALCLAAAGHLDAIQPGRPSGNYQLYKTMVMQEISARMRERETATSNVTIHALSCILSFEMSKCTNEPILHLRGIRGLLSQYQEIPVAVKALDIIHAVLFDSDLVFAADLNVASAGMSAPETDHILFSELQDFLQSADTAARQAIHGLGSLLRDFSICIQNIGRGNTNTSSLWTLQASLTSYHPGELDNATGSDIEHLQQSWYSTIRIFYNVINAKQPFRHESNQRHATNIFQALRKISFTSWHSLPYQRLFILLTAGATTLDNGMKGFIQAELSRTMYNMGQAEWPRIEAFVLTVLARIRLLGSFAI